MQFGSTSVRARTYRPTNAFALRVIEDEKAHLDLPMIMKVQAAFRGNSVRKTLRTERAIRVSRQVRSKADIHPPFTILNAPTDGASSVSLKVVEAPGSKYRPTGGAKQRPRLGLGQAQRSRFNDLAALPRKFHHRTRTRVRLSQSRRRSAAERFPQGFVRVVYAAAICWMLLAGGYAAVLGVHFDRRTSLQWLTGLGAATGWQAIIVEPVSIALVVVTGKCVEAARSVYFRFFHHLPFQG